MTYTVKYFVIRKLDNWKHEKRKFFGCNEFEQAREFAYAVCGVLIHTASQEIMYDALITE